MPTNTTLIYGIKVASSLPLPGWPTFQAEPDVTIIEGTCPSNLQDAHTQRPNFQANHDECLLTVPSMGRVHLERSGTITLDMKPHLLESWKVTLALGSGLGTWLHMRGMVPMHGVAWAEGDNAIVALGPSGAGKSTLAAAVMASGRKLISDDVITLRTDEGTQKILAVPAHNRIKLSGDSLAHWRAHEPHGLFRENWRVSDQPVLPESPKYAFTVPERFMQPEALPIKHCLLLSRRRSGKPWPKKHQLTAMAALPVVQRHVYRKSLAATFGNFSELFETLGTLCHQTTIDAIAMPDLRLHDTLKSYGASVVNGLTA